MKRNFCQLLFVLLSFPFVLSAEDNGRLTGRVVLETGGEAVGAIVFLEGTKIGAAADGEGNFTIENIPHGTYNVIARLVGSEQSSPVPVTIAGGKSVSVEIQLRSSAVEMKAVEISASRRQAADDARVSVTVMLPREAKFLPGAAEDVLRSLQSLPGVLATSDFSSQLTIRGSGPDQNLIAIDGFEVLNPYRLYGFISMFNPETVSDINLQTGGFSARYGDRLSAVLDVKNREGNGDDFFSGKINSSITNANLIMEGRLPSGGNWIASARRTYYDLVVGPFLRATNMVEGDVALPNFRDLQVKATMPLNAEHKLILNGITSRDGVQMTTGAERERPDSVSVFDQSYNTLAGVTWQYTPAEGVLSQTLFSWYRNEGEGAFDGTIIDPAQNNGEIKRADTLGLRFFAFGMTYSYEYRKMTLGQNFSYTFSGHLVEFGGAADWLQTTTVRHFLFDDNFQTFVKTRGGALPNDVSASLKYSRYNLWVQDRISIGDGFFIQPGLRYDFFPYLNNNYLAPRVNASLRIDPVTTMRAAYGVYYQSPGMDKQDFRATLQFTENSFKNLDAEKADHYILGIDRMVTADWQFKSEIYYKNFSNLVVPDKKSGTTWSSSLKGSDPYRQTSWSSPVRIARDSITLDPVNDASGDAYGIEFMLQKIQSAPADKFSGWITYALSYAERNRRGIISPFQFDQRHAINVVGSYKLDESWEFGLNFMLRSGRPYVRALGIKPRVIVQKINGVEIPFVQTDAGGKVILDVETEKDALTGRLSTYHSLDLRVTTYPQWWGLRWSFYLDISNIYNHSNEQSVRYFITEQGTVGERIAYGLPIFPAIGFSLTF